jgi:hypothetical protein
MEFDVGGVAAFTALLDVSALASARSAVDREPKIHAVASAATRSAPTAPMTTRRRVLVRPPVGLAAREPAKWVALDTGTAAGNSDPRG